MYDSTSGVQYGAGVEFEGKWYIFGGRMTDGLIDTVPQYFTSHWISNQLWIYNFSKPFLCPLIHCRLIHPPEEATWTQEQCTGDVPTVYGHSLAVYKNELW
jgi:hypothetical protein